MNEKLALMALLALRNGANIDQVTAVAGCTKAEVYARIGEATKNNECR